jgi:hypothetical protein
MACQCVSGSPAHSDLQRSWSASVAGQRWSIGQPLTLPVWPAESRSRALQLAAGPTDPRRRSTQLCGPLAAVLAPLSRVPAGGVPGREAAFTGGQVLTCGTWSGGKRMRKRPQSCVRRSSNRWSRIQEVIWVGTVAAPCAGKSRHRTTPMSGPEKDACTARGFALGAPGGFRRMKRSP